MKKHKSLIIHLVCVCFFLFSASLSSNGQGALSIQIKSSSDDAEESGSDGSSGGGIVDLTSQILQLVHDNDAGSQLVGLRFSGINLPEGATVISSHIQFTSGEPDNADGTLEIRVEESDDSETFSSSASNISSRELTDDFVEWSGITAWAEAGISSSIERTPDLSQLINTVTQREGWASGNAITFVLSGTGRRVASSYDFAPSASPVLYIEYASYEHVEQIVTSTNDDAEQWGPDSKEPGNLERGGSDLDMVEDFGLDHGTQTVGIRFNELNIPQGAIISNARIQFTAKEDDDLAPAELYLFVQNETHPVEFSSADYDITSREVIEDSVIWDVPVWDLIDEKGDDQKTPNLSELIQEIVNKDEWNENSSLVFVIKGSGERIAHSEKGGVAKSPQLIIDYLPGGSEAASGFPVSKRTFWLFDDKGNDLGDAWKNQSYTDHYWAYKAGLHGFGVDSLNNQLSFGSDENNKIRTYYFKHNFQVESASLYNQLVAGILVDGGAVVYLNGTEVIRHNIADGEVDFTTLASSETEDEDEELYNEYSFDNLLVDGINTLAVELHISSADDLDAAFDLTLDGILGPLPVSGFPFEKESRWSYLDDGSDLSATDWTTISYNSDNWAHGPGALGFGDPMNTEISYGLDDQNKFVTYYFRKKFNVSDVSSLSEYLEIGLRRDDGAVVYLNGAEVVRTNMPEGTITASTFSQGEVGGDSELEYVSFYVSSDFLVNGDNIIAVEVHNASLTNPDIHFDLELKDAPNFEYPTTGCPEGDAHISCFNTITPTSQTSNFLIADSHRFQTLFKQGTQYTTSDNSVPGNHDFTGFVSIDGRSDTGYVSVNHETTPGGVSILDVWLDSSDHLWKVSNTHMVDMYDDDLVTTTRNCSGGVTPWRTVITCEETSNSGDDNGDGYQDVGWAVEIDPATRSVKDYGNGKKEKLWALGRVSHENVVVASDSMTVYYGEDGGTSCVYKFIADSKMDLSSGSLYVLKLDGPLVNDEPTAATGEWVQIANATQADRNNTSDLGGSAGTRFDGVEDVEIHPTTGEIYFTSKGQGRVFKFTSTGNDITNFQTFVGGKSYLLVTEEGLKSEPWGTGNDNLAFDDRGNLWVLQDGSEDYIWIVRNGHTQENPKVDIFASTPSGSEPTGITFSPDYKYLFMSIQGPSSSNTSQKDATFTDIVFDKSTSIVISRAENLGMQTPVVSFIADLTEVTQGDSVSFEDQSTNSPDTWDWNFDGGLPASSKDQNPVVVYEEPGLFTVELVASNAAGLDTMRKVDYILVNEAQIVDGGDEALVIKEELEEVKIYPNPFRDKLYVEFVQEKPGAVEVSMVDMSGQLISVLYSGTQNEGNVSLEIRNLPNAVGTYVLIIKSGDKQIKKLVQVSK